MPEAATGMIHIPWMDYLIIGIYMVLVLGIGAFFSKNEKNATAYLLGGRNMPFLAIGLSCMMSLLSAISIVTVPCEVYNHGLSLFVLNLLLMPVMVIPGYLLFTRFYFKLGSFTPYEYLEFRYSSSVRTLLAAASFYGRVLYIGNVLFATAKIFEGAYGWPTWLTILGVGIVGTVYTVMGGMKAVVWTDVLQYFVLFGGFVVITVILCVKIDGGAVEAVRYAFQQGHGLSEFSNPDFYKLTPYIRLSFWLLLWSALLAPIESAASDQINVQRLLSTKDWKAGLKAQIVSTVTAIPFVLVLWFLGLAIFTYYGQNPGNAPKNGDTVFFQFVGTHVPPVLSGIFIAGMLAAIMSTLDSGINSMATVWLKEFHVRFINKKLDNTGEVRIARRATILIGLFAIVFGISLDWSARFLMAAVNEIGTLFATLIGAAVLPAYLFAVLSKRSSTTLIWSLTIFGLGESIIGKVWYASSHAAVIRINQMLATGLTEVPLGWAGPLPYLYFIVPCLAGLGLCAEWLLKPEKRESFKVKTAALTGVALLGVASIALQWCLYSHFGLEAGQPGVRSFAFGLPMTLIAGFIALRFCKVQPREKYQGLTLSTIHMPVLIKK